MTQFFVQLPEGGTITLDLDLDTTTVAAVKATVDARLESIWRASGVRILRSDLPFCGIILRYQNRILAMNEVLSSCKIRSQSTLCAQWPQKSEKDERGMRYGKGRDNKPAWERRIREERELKRAKRERKSAEKVLRGAAEKKSSKVVDDTTQYASETGGDEQISGGCESDDWPGDETIIEAEGDSADAGGDGAQGLNEEVADEEQEEQQAEEGQQERPTGEVEHDDPFADDDGDKENRAPEFAPIMQTRANGHPADEWLAFDEGNSAIGMDLLEEVLEF